MAVACHSEDQSQLDVASHASARPMVPRRKRVVLLVVVNLFAFATAFLTAEAAFRLFWNPRYWIHCDRLMIGSGQTEVGKKWWPNTTYLVEGSEFRLQFRTDTSGYRARPEPVTAEHPYRIAFVGDSFTEAMQVPYESAFCAQLERLLNQSPPSRSKVCVNYGISATDLFDYWHRIIHDVLPTNPPDALVLCIFPGNDFQGLLPDDGFDSEGRPLHDYFRKPGWSKHVIAWINLHFEIRLLPSKSPPKLESRSNSVRARAEELVVRPGSGRARRECDTLEAIPLPVPGDRRGMPAASYQALYPCRRTCRQLSLEGRSESSLSDSLEVADRCPGDRCGDQGPRSSRLGLTRVPLRWTPQRIRPHLCCPGSGGSTPGDPGCARSRRSAVNLPNPEIGLRFPRCSEALRKLRKTNCRTTVSASPDCSDFASSGIEWTDRLSLDVLSRR